MTSPMYACARRCARRRAGVVHASRCARATTALVEARRKASRAPTSLARSRLVRASVASGRELAHLGDDLRVALADAPGDDVLVLEVPVVDVEMAHDLVRVGLRVEAERRDEAERLEPLPDEEDVEERSSERLALTPTRPTTSSAAARIAKAAARRAPRGTRRRGFTPVYVGAPALALSAGRDRYQGFLISRIVLTAKAIAKPIGPAIEVALDERAAAQGALPGADAEGARQPCILPRVHEDQEDQDDADHDLEDGEDQFHRP